MPNAMSRLVLLVVVGALVAGCGVRDRIANFRDDTERALPFKASLSVGEDARDFVVTVKTPNGPAELSEMRESARYQATRHCLRRFGASDAIWTLDEATGDWAVLQSGTTASMSGRCTAI